LQSGHDGKDSHSNGNYYPISSLVYSIAKSVYETAVRNSQADETNKHIAGATDAIAKWTRRLVYVGAFTGVVGLLTIVVL
jgi:hypothetical protein